MKFLLHVRTCRSQIRSNPHLKSILNVIVMDEYKWLSSGICIEHTSHKRTSNYILFTRNVIIDDQFSHKIYL